MKTPKNWLISIRRKIPRPYPEMVKLVMSYDSLWRAPEILFLGDSVLKRISRDDSDKRSVNQILASLLAGKKRMHCIAKPAYHLAIYYHLLKVLTCTHQKPEMVIFPVNMRSFSPQWDLNPAWQFEWEIEMLNKYCEAPGIKPFFQQRLPVSYELSEIERSRQVTYPFTELDRIGQFIDLINSKPTTDHEKQYRKKQIFIFHYLHELSPNHPKILILKKALELLRELKIRALIYITPMNYQGGERLVGNGFMNLVRANAEVLRHSIASCINHKGVHLLDLEEAFTAEYFFSADEASEHLNQSGRAQLAKTLANEISLDW